MSIYSGKRDRLFVSRAISAATHAELPGYVASVSLPDSSSSSSMLGRAYSDLTENGFLILKYLSQVESNNAETKNPILKAVIILRNRTSLKCSEYEIKGKKIQQVNTRINRTLGSSFAYRRSSAGDKCQSSGIEVAFGKKIQILSLSKYRAASTTTPTKGYKTTIRMTDSLLSSRTEDKVKNKIENKNLRATARTPAELSTDGLLSCFLTQSFPRIFPITTPCRSKYPFLKIVQKKSRLLNLSARGLA